FEIDALVVADGKAILKNLEEKRLKRRFPGDLEIGCRQVSTRFQILACSDPTDRDTKGAAVTDGQLVGWSVNERDRRLRMRKGYPQVGSASNGVERRPK